MKKIMLTALSLVAMATAQAQINLGKMAGAAFQRRTSPFF